MENSSGDFFGVETGSLNLDYSDFTNQLYIQTIFAQKFLIGGGAELKHLKIKSETVDDVSEQVFDNSDYFSLYGYLKYDTYDNKYFPKRGWYFNGEAKAFLFSSDYNEIFGRFTIVKGDIGFVRQVVKNVAVELRSEGGFGLGNQSVPFFDFILGGYGFYPTNNFRHFYGYDFLSLAGNSYIKGRASADWEFFRKNHLNFSANYAIVGNNIYDEGDFFSKPDYSGYAFGYGLETIIGPIEIKHSWSPETKDHFTWISVGFWF
jgi:NTE family protein